MTAPATHPALSASGLRAGYGSKTVLQGIDISLAAGEVLAILGHNGAGKSTLARTLFGIVPVSAGRVTHHGSDVTGRAPDRSVSAGVSFVPQGHGVFKTLSVRRNLALGGYALQSRPDGERHAAETIEMIFGLFPILRERLNQLAGTMSGGQQQMLAIGIALMQRPNVLILDEPSIGLAPNLVDRVMQGIRHINRRLGVSVLMVEQSVNHALKIADRVVLLKAGEKVYDGDPAPLSDHMVLMKYF